MFAYVFIILVAILCLFPLYPFYIAFFEEIIDFFKKKRS